MFRLKELREQQRLSQEGLGLKLGVSQSTISVYELGERVPDLNVLIKLAKIFDVSLDYLVGLSDVRQRMMSSDLSPDELEYLQKYRRLGAVNKEKVKAYIDGLSSK